MTVEYRFTEKIEYIGLGMLEDVQGLLGAPSTLNARDPRNTYLTVRVSGLEEALELLDWIGALFSTELYFVD